MIIIKEPIFENYNNAQILIGEKLHKCKIINKLMTGLSFTGIYKVQKEDGAILYISYADMINLDEILEDLICNCKVDSKIFAQLQSIGVKTKTLHGYLGSIFVGDIKSIDRYKVKMQSEVSK